MKRIALLYGGKSGEHEVSLDSAASILRHLDRASWEPILIGIDHEGLWWLQPPEARATALAETGPLRIEKGCPVLVLPGGGVEAGLATNSSGLLAPLACDLVFPVLHGTFGEDGTIQGLVECAELPCVGAPVLGSALGMDKEKAKLIWMQRGLPVVPFIARKRAELERQAGEAGLRQELEASFGYPAFVKPASAGSSVGASKVEGPGELANALRAALAWDDKVLIEPFVSAREIECSVLGNGSFEAFSPGEIVPSHEFYDYEAKYLDPNGALLCVPANLPEEQTARVRELAVAACEALDIAGMARVDFFIERATGRILLNELNTIPGFTAISMFPMMCEAGGLAYSKLISRLAELAIDRCEARKRLRYSFREV